MLSRVWSPTRDPKQLVLQELQAEREAANKVKQEQRILVILGNPPYDGFAGFAVAEDMTWATLTARCTRPVVPLRRAKG